jgi:hypothetical protein
VVADPTRLAQFLGNLGISLFTTDVGSVLEGHSRRFSFFVSGQREGDIRPATDWEHVDFSEFLAFFFCFLFFPREMI